MTMIEAPPLTRHAGWLHRAWFRHLEAQELAGTHRSGRHDYMCSTGLAEIVEPFVTVPALGPGAGGPDEHVLRFDGVDGEAAAALIATLPEVALKQELSTFAPSSRTMLTAVVASGGTVTCGGELISPSLPMGGMRVRSLAVRDPEMLEQGPEVGADVPEWVDELPAAAARWYVQDRRSSLDHGLMRQAWAIVSSRYGIGGAHFPAARILTNGDGVRVGVRFVW